MENQVVIPIDEHRIYGMLHMPQHSPNDKLPVVVICHGFVSNKVGQHRIFVQTARQLCQAGFAVLRFDYIGCGESTGEYQNITLPRQVNETIGVIDFLVAHPNINSHNVILLGHSLGGCIASNVAGLDKRIKKLILWSPVAKPLEDIVGIVGDELYQACLDSGIGHYQGFQLGREFFKSLSRTLPLERVKDFQGNVLIIHGTNDVETPLANAHFYEHALSERLQGIQKVKVIDGADHTYNSPLWEQEVIEATLQWLK